MFNSSTKEKIIESVSSIGIIVIQLSGIVLSILTIIYLIQGTLVEKAASFLLILNSIGAFVLFFLVVILIPLSFFKKTRLLSGIAIFFLSYVFGLQLWIFSAIVAYLFWGWLAFLIGLFLAGIGVLPVAMLASIFNGEWLVLENLIFGIILTSGSRYLGYYLINKAEQQEYADEQSQISSGLMENYASNDTHDAETKELFEESYAESNNKNGIEEYYPNHEYEIKDFSRKNILISGVAGSGKSNFLHRYITALMKRNDSKRTKFLLIDTKGTEFPIYDGMLNLLVGVTHAPVKAVNAFSWLWAESLKRLKEIEKLHCSSIYEYNKETYIKNKLPEIIVVIDEFSDLMSHDKSFFEDRIEKITGLSKMTGIYLVVATSKLDPEDVATEGIRASFPTRIAFRLLNEADSIFFIGEYGAEKLSMPGGCLVKDMLRYKVNGLQTPYISEEELIETVEKIKEKPISFQQFEESGDSEENEEDELYSYAKDIVIDSGQANAAILGRKLKVSYARAARLIDMLEEKGVVGSANGASPREVFPD